VARPAQRNTHIGFPALLLWKQMMQRDQVARHEALAQLAGF
jgi:hypothetical protein